MKKLIIFLCLIAFTFSVSSQTWRQSDGDLRTLNADLSLTNVVQGDLTYNINGQEFDTRAPVSPKLYKADRILGVRLVGPRLVIKYTGYVRHGEWIGRIVWKEIYHVNAGVVKLQGIVDGNYTPPKSTDETVTFQDE